VEDVSGRENRGEALVVASKKRARAKKGRKKKAGSSELSDLEVLQKIQDDIFRKLKEGEFQPKVADLIRVLENKHKLKLKLLGDGKKNFWDLVEQIRREELGGDDEEEN
jgi:hypothetical protein